METEIVRLTMNKEDRYWPSHDSLVSRINLRDDMSTKYSFEKNYNIALIKP